MEPTLVTTAEAAEILEVTPTTVYYYRRDYPDFPEPRHFGRTLAWDPAKLRRWRAQHPRKESDPV